MKTNIDVNNDFNVAAVIVTYNRLEKLKNAIAAYENQLCKPTYIIVVNNASNDGTKEFLSIWKEEKNGISKIVINMNDNLGGSGGFYEGQKAAMQLNDVEWIMVADDDAYPEEDYLLIIKEYLERENTDDIAVICGKVIENESFVNTHRTVKTGFFSPHLYKPILQEEYDSYDAIELDYASYVGIVINKKKMDIAGCVNPELFIYHDDTDHTYRLGGLGNIICLTQISIIHDCGMTKINENTWKAYYDYRNRLYVSKKINFKKFLYLIPVYIAKSLLCPLKGRQFGDIIARLTAVFDGIRGILGKHPVYAPGWKP